MRNERGQSVLEMAIMLPVILLLIYGLEFLRDLVTARIRAVEASRFVAWEALAPGGGARSDADLAQDLRSIGLGTGLVEVRAEEARRSIGAFAAAIEDRPLPKSVAAPRGLAGLFPDDDRAGGDLHRRFRDLGAIFRSAMPAELLEQVPDDHLALRVVQAVEGASLAAAGSPALFSLPDLLADAAGFGREASQSVVTSRVVYRFRGRGFFGAAPAITFRESSSLMIQPFAKKACSGEECDSAEDARGLWLVPNGIPVAPNYDVSPTLLVRAEDRADAARLKARVEGLSSTAVRLPLVGKALDFRLPSVKADVYPELELGDDAGNAAEGEDGFGDGIGGAGGGPFAEEVGR